MIPIPGQANAEKGELMRNLTEFLRGFPLRILIFLLDMVLPQLDAYHVGRQLQHFYPWTSVLLAQRQERGHPGVELQASKPQGLLHAKYIFEALEACLAGLKACFEACLPQQQRL